MTKLPPSDIAALPYRPGVGIALFNRANQVFVGQRLDNPGPAWQMPQGGIDEGESPLDAAWREMLEEIGTTQAELIGECEEWLYYDLPPELASKLWKGRYRGQRQKWFAFRFIGEDSEINIRTAHPEFSTWRWIALEEIAAVIVPFKRDLYLALMKELKKITALS